VHRLFFAAAGHPEVHGRPEGIPADIEQQQLVAIGYCLGYWLLAVVYWLLGLWGEATPCVGEHDLAHVNASGERMRSYTSSCAR
jgi:hypothetical protein